MPNHGPIAQEHFTLDKKDYEILRLLQADGKLTVREIASKIHLSPTPVHERIKRLEQHEVIKQYVALLNSSRVNKRIKVICHVSLREHNKLVAKPFIEAILSAPQVIECYNISGEFDFMLKIVAESIDDYHHFHTNYLTEIKGIGQMRSTFVMETIKETHVII
jgi:DNA-binding Lrp family transcriptional regulator